MNSQNSNQGGTGDSAISKIVTEAVDVSSPEGSPDTPILGGSSFLAGSPAGREAQPKPHYSGAKGAQLLG